jgi:hypothetical protein
MRIARGLLQVAAVVTLSLGAGRAFAQVKDKGSAPVTVTNTPLPVTASSALPVTAPRALPVTVENTPSVNVANWPASNGGTGGKSWQISNIITHTFLTTYRYTTYHFSRSAMIDRISIGCEGALGIVPRAFLAGSVGAPVEGVTSDDSLLHRAVATLPPFVLVAGPTYVIPNVEVSFPVAAGASVELQVYGDLVGLPACDVSLVGHFTD